MILVEWKEANNEHTRNKKIGILSVVLANRILFSDIASMIQQLITIKRQRDLTMSALNGKNESMKK
ncbi:MAG: hypothetical protein A3G70_02025 [Planctomycetes bacterium RIFCSPLOWO2_12_FULL_39_13]|nr:MAG: hypothetical protein A3G70_02025 [Planctomycetes bacterium RIFCSPLOWO2_12_FULL_39_13]